MRLISSMSPRSSNRVAIVPYPKVGAQLHARGRYGNPTRPFPVGALCTFSADLVLRPVADDALVEVIPLVVLVDRLLPFRERHAFSPNDLTRAANHSTLVDSTPMRFLHFGSSRSCQDFGTSASFTALLL